MADSNRKDLTNKEMDDFQPVSTNVLDTADSFIRQKYLTALSEAQIVPLPKKLQKIVPGTNVRLMKLDKLVYPSKDELREQMEDLFASLCWTDSTVCYLVDAKDTKADFYLGISMHDELQLSVAKRFFGGTMNGTVPGLSFTQMRVPQQQELLDELFNEDGLCVASVSISDFDFANSKDSRMPSGIERLLDGMHGRPFSMLALSRYMKPDEIVIMRTAYETIYSQLSQFQSIQYSVSEGDNDSYSKSIATSETKTINESTTTSRNYTKGTTIAPEAPRQMENAITTAIGAAAGLVISTATLNPNPMGMSVGLGLGTALNTAYNGFRPIEGDAHRKSQQESESQSTGEQSGFSISDGSSLTESNTTGRNSSSSKSITKTNQNVVNLLEKLDRKIKNLMRLESTGAYDTCVYFFAGNRQTALMAANQFRTGLSCTKASYTSLAVNIWDNKDEAGQLRAYLSRMYHPVFQFPEDSNYPQITGAQPVSTVDMSAVLKLPQRVVAGLNMGEYATFARSIDCDNSDESFSVGQLLHMGKSRQDEIQFPLNSMVRHMFVSGMTGMGKSNFCYLLVDQLVKHGKKVLVIEPAKGQYRQVFGGREDFFCYGTNSRVSAVLRLNPFSFPDDVHVSEHIDRLIGIFSACWPLYAAMPAMLKDAVEMCYEDCGFDLETGERFENARFPTFHDLLSALPKVIESSDYSDRSKGDYSGSLITRVKSLTNGIFRQIFTSDELTPEELFGRNVLIDLSRVGGAESKALIMGILIMRLSEFRASENLMDSDLRHVTFLEEAHHLLRANAHGYSEGANVQAASTEMITNAIAEIRTYGEGFVIADQAPAIMDQSAIRNTYTKVVFKLPNEVDRKSVGTAMALTEAQLSHIARLQIGEAVIYQGGWNEPVLCKTAFFSPENFCAEKFVPQIPKSRIQMPVQTVKKDILRIALADAQPAQEELQLCKNILENARMHRELGDAVWDFLNDVLIGRKDVYSGAQYRRVVCSLIDPQTIIQELNTWEKTSARFDWLLRELEEKYQLLPDSCVKLTDILLSNASFSNGALLAAWTGYKTIRNLSD